MTSTLSGTFPVLPTPFRDDGSVAEDDFLALIDFALEAGVDGVVFPGVASEVQTLTAAERTSLVALLGRRLVGRLPFIVGASDPDADAAGARAREGCTAGAAAAMVMAPARLGADVEAQIAYFTAIAAAAGLPVMLQNAPLPVGAGLTPETVARIAMAVEGVTLVKEETPPCGQHLTRIQTAAGSSLSGIFGGAGGRYIIDELRRGSAGTMPALELADVHVALVNAWRADEQSRARELFRQALPLLNFQAIFRMHMGKAVLRRRGVIRHTFVRADGPVMDAQDRVELDTLLADAAHLFSIYPIP